MEDCEVLGCITLKPNDFNREICLIMVRNFPLDLTILRDGSTYFLLKTNSLTEKSVKLRFESLHPRDFPVRGKI